METLRNERAVYGVVAVLLALLCYVAVDAMRERIVDAGDRAPDFSIKTDDGRTITRSNFGGRVLVLNFWATWCSPCIEEIPSLNQFQSELAGSGVVVLAVSVDRSEKAYRDFLKRVRVSFLTARDPEANISGSYGTFKYPETYVINSQGEVVEKFISNQNWTDPNIINRIKSML